MKRVKWALVGGLALQASSLFGQEFVPALTFCPRTPPEVASQLSLRAVVEMIGPPRQVTREVIDPELRKSNRTFWEFQVKVKQSGTFPAGADLTCLSSIEKPVEVRTHGNFLLMGWTPVSGRLSVAPETILERLSKKSPDSVVSHTKEAFAWLLVPTELDRVVLRTQPPASVYLTLTQALQKTDDIAYRQISSMMAALPDLDTARTLIDSKQPGAWYRDNLLPKIRKFARGTVLQRFRTGGLEAHWATSEEKLNFLSQLPDLIASLELASANRLERLGENGSGKAFDARADDLAFLGMIDLITGVPPDKVIDLALRFPRLRRYALDPRLGKPSLEGQRNIITFFTSPSQDERAMALNHFARWYNEPGRRTSVRWSDEARGTVVFREAEHAAYWRDKIIGQPPPAE